MKAILLSAQRLSACLAYFFSSRWLIVILPSCLYSCGGSGSLGTCTIHVHGKSRDMTCMRGLASQETCMRGFAMSLGTWLVRESRVVKGLAPPMFATGLETRLVRKGWAFKGLVPPMLTVSLGTQILREGRVVKGLALSMFLVSLGTRFEHEG